MCRVRTIDVGDDPHPVATARRATAPQLARWDLAELRPDAELLVSELVTNAVLHGVAMLARGKQVWFRLEVAAGWPHRTACPCAGDDLERVRLESGRWAVAAPGPWDDR